MRASQAAFEVDDETHAGWSVPVRGSAVAARAHHPQAHQRSTARARLGSEPIRRAHLKVQVNTDKNVEVSADFAERIEADVASALARFERRLTRVEVHLRDESAGRIAGESRTCGQPIPP